MFFEILENVTHWKCYKKCYKIDALPKKHQFVTLKSHICHTFKHLFGGILYREDYFKATGKALLQPKNGRCIYLSLLLKLTGKNRQNILNH